MRALRRLAIWGLSAAGALAIAVAAAFSDAGARRLLASAPAPNVGAVQKTAPPAAPAPDRDAENRRLTEVMGVLIADRERLVERLGALERNLEDVTGSLARQAAAGAAAAPPAPASPQVAVPAAPPASKEAALAPPVEPGAPARPALIAVPAPTAPSNPAGAAPPAASPELSAAPSGADPTELGVDIGGALNFDGLRVLWASTKGSNGALLEGLHPVVAPRENSRSKTIELRLIAGPLASPEAAARICAALTAARRYCQPVAFEGHRLANADAVPERRPAAPPKAAAPAPSKSAFPFR